MIREYTRPAPIKEILEEHVEEVAFMYESRYRSFVDPELSWEDLSEYEQRMYPHLHGLVLGGVASAKLLKDKLTLDEDEEPGETFVASIVYSMLDLIEPMQWLIEALGQNPPHSRAIVDGLKYSKGRDLDGWLKYFLEHENPTVRAVGSEVTGYRGLKSLKDKLISHQEDPDPRVSMEAIYSLAYMGIMPTRNPLNDFLNNQDPFIVWKAIELFLKMGESEATAFCKEKCSTPGLEINRKLVLYLAISGSNNDLHLISNLSRAQPEIKKECLLALGICGNTEAIDLLIDNLDRVDDLDTFVASYQGLRIITGMDYIPEFDPDEVEPQEVLKYQALWMNWWQSNRNNFANNIKYRRGEKISPLVLYKDLLRPGNPCRDMTYREMAIRFECPEGFQHDNLYEIQDKQLQKLQKWATQYDKSFKPGLSYYHGKILS